MKFIKSIILCGLCLMALSSCNEWLNVNIDPENPSSESATYQTRLAHIEFYTNHAIQIGGWRVSMSMGDWTRYSGGGTYMNMSFWSPAAGITTTPYQWWFVGAACNVEDLYYKAVAAEAWHYAGVAKIIKAYGFMHMTDLYGEMPYSDGIGENATPLYDKGDEIYVGCLKDLDEGLALLAKGQDSSLPPLSAGDYWCNGDPAKWIKFGNLLKARFCVKLSKKSPGSYLNGQYDVQTILDALSKGPQSVADDAVITHTDDYGTSRDVLGWNEPVDYSPLYSVCGMNAGYMPTKTLYDNLTNFAGYGVEDPRADKILPWAWSAKSADTPKEIKWSGNWRRSLGVDMTSSNSPLLTGGPIRASFNTKWYIDSKSAERLGDTVYVESTSSSKGYAANKDLLYRRASGNDKARESGSFYSRVSAPTFLGTYAEACFIKAEVLFNNGDNNGAFAAYKEGVKASMERMNVSLKAWVAGDASLADCPSFTPMTDAEINNFINNGIGTAGNLTLGKIMTQKRIALLFSTEIWNDMRRYDYDKNIFMNWDVAAYHAFSADALKAIPQGKDFRRWMQCSHELNYNSTNLHAIGEFVQGADMTIPDDEDTPPQWNNKPDVWTLHVWWDSSEPYAPREEFKERVKAREGFYPVL